MKPSKLTQIIELLKGNPQIEVAWLYGSRATNTHSNTSDFDVAVAFHRDPATEHAWDRELDDLQYRLRDELQLPVSLVDINRIPIPLAQNIVTQGKTLLCTSDLRLRMEEQRIWSLWEEYKFEHEHNRKAF